MSRQLLEAGGRACAWLARACGTPGSRSVALCTAEHFRLGDPLTQHCSCRALGSDSFHRDWLRERHPLRPDVPGGGCEPKRGKAPWSGQRCRWALRPGPIAPEPTLTGALLRLSRSPARRQALCCIAGKEPGKGKDVNKDFCTSAEVHGEFSECCSPAPAASRRL